ncbi:amidase [Isoalcanivorax beigongshangi]|uniref:Amidase n=1 Tax=Isoalcanivorax beigongshangi TaxID=3238810 RepID=A0ABV4AG76_9GAMM
MERLHVFTDDALGRSDATDLAERLARREVSQEEVTEAAIERLQRAAPLQAMVLDTFDAARQRARSGSASGAFAGVPTLIKDNIDVQGLPTRQGSAAVGAKPLKQTSELAQQYLAQGFNLLGKSTLPAFGFTATTETAHQPATRNPWSLAHSSGGSSGGSAALVAAGAVPIAHANDGGGSIRIPAACCGLVGLKSTRGRLVVQEAARALPINIVSDGVVTRSVRDTARFFAAAELHYRNPALPPIGNVTGPGQRRLRIGVMTDSLIKPTTCPDTLRALEQTSVLLADLGHQVEPARIALPGRFVDDFLLYWGMLAFSIQTLGPLLMRQGFERRQLDLLTKGLSRHFGRNFWKAPGMLRQLKKSSDQYAQSLADYDVVLTPVLAHTTVEIGYLAADLPFEIQMERLLEYITFTPANNASGAPAIALPLAETSTGLPLGLQFCGRHGDERTLLELAFELEAAQPFRLLAD